MLAEGEDLTPWISLWISDNELHFSQSSYQTYRNTIRQLQAYMIKESGRS